VVTDLQYIVFHGTIRKKEQWEKGRIERIKGGEQGRAK
jgi:hypothetical protein